MKGGERERERLKDRRKGQRTRVKRMKNALSIVSDFANICARQREVCKLPCRPRYQR